MLVQSCNDLLAGPDGYLSPESSVACSADRRTADPPDGVVHAWLTESLVNPRWGVVRYAKLTAIKAIVDIAEQHRAASGHIPPFAEWVTAERAARGASSSPESPGRVCRPVRM
jgi:hypothetical protein